MCSQMFYCQITSKLYTFDCFRCEYQGISKCLTHTPLPTKSRRNKGGSYAFSWSGDPPNGQTFDRFPIRNAQNVPTFSPAALSTKSGRSCQTKGDHTLWYRLADAHSFGWVCQLVAMIDLLDGVIQNHACTMPCIHVHECCKDFLKNSRAGLTAPNPNPTELT